MKVVKRKFKNIATVAMKVVSELKYKHFYTQLYAEKIKVSNKIHPQLLNINVFVVF